ncbi:GIY-YIG nuclease family protein [Alsobacter sp. R-9]
MFIYIMTSGKFCKVGISKRPKARRNSMTTASPKPLSLFASIRSANAAEVERQAHELLKPHRTSGEWFDVNLYIALTVVEHLATGDHSRELVDACVEIQGHSRALNRYCKDEDDRFARWSFLRSFILANWRYAGQNILKI